MASTTALAEQNPALIWDTINAYQKTACLHAAIDLNLFTHIAEGAQSTAEIAARCSASERGIRILCDALAVQGLLVKEEDRYRLSTDSAVFLDKRSPAYMGAALSFLNSKTMMRAFDDMAEVVRRGTTSLEGAGTIDPEDAVWVDFAKSMTAMVAPAADFIGQIAAGDGPQRVLDIAAGHGLFGISIARRNPQAQIVPVDWAPVLEVAKTNAGEAGVLGRYRPIAGDAFQVDFGSGYDVVLLTNFLHHFDIPTCETLLRKVRASLAPAGKVYTLEFVPNEDRVTPPPAAWFSVIMLATTPSGDAYTFDELSRMFANAGFAKTERVDLTRSPETVLVSS